MNNARIALGLLLAASLGLSAAAAEEKITKPRSSEVVVVARIQFAPALDRDFFSSYAAFETPYVKVSGGKRAKKDVVPADTMVMYTREAGKKANSAFMDPSFFYTKTPFGSPGDVAFAKMSIPKSREIEIDHVRVYLADNGFFFFDLPIARRIVVPEGANYVYLGSFTYTLENEYFHISNIALSDEFDGAQARVAKVFGEGARLMRVNLIKLGAE